jgi:hypothetical protein
MNGEEEDGWREEGSRLDLREMHGCCEGKG